MVVHFVRRCMRWCGYDCRSGCTARWTSPPLAIVFVPRHPADTPCARSRAPPFAHGAQDVLVSDPAGGVLGLWAITLTPHGAISVLRWHRARWSGLGRGGIAPIGGAEGGGDPEFGVGFREEEGAGTVKFQTPGSPKWNSPFSPPRAIHLSHPYSIRSAKTTVHSSGGTCLSSSVPKAHPAPTRSQLGGRDKASSKGAASLSRARSATTAASLVLLRYLPRTMSCFARFRTFGYSLPCATIMDARLRLPRPPAAVAFPRARMRVSDAEMRRAELNIDRTAPQQLPSQPADVGTMSRRGACARRRRVRSAPFPPLLPP
ncbi:hypothetical protein C8R45DRAFT_635368 [Mycena sanguinolenta]|nr:hypothetical protein C8R45DRAFT_635368 [Mycena sanguinolenta]